MRAPASLRFAPLAPAARLPRPGPLWGAYPERGDRNRSRPPLRASARWPAARVARNVIERLAAADATGVDEREAIPSPAEIRARLARDGLREAAVTDALTAACREMARRIGLRPVRAQVLCAALLLQGRLVEMDTGEGKTCAAALAAAVAGMAGAMVHVLTANEYLAERDQRGLAPLFDALGLRSASVRESDEAARRRDAYRARIVYATARCVAFDSLRDQQHGADARRSPVDALDGAIEPPLLNGLCMAIVDEADSVLIDEADTPLVLSEPVDDPALRGRVWRALTLAGRLARGADFAPAEGRPGQWTLTAAGRERIDAWSAAFGDPWRHPLYREELIEQALHALHGLRRDVDYLVQDGQVVIVDAASGRPAGQRRWSRDLHALVALDEGLPVPAANRTVARTTYPRLFARYHHVCGLSGTLRECRAELRRQYGLAVGQVPHTQPLRRRARPMRAFADRAAQFDAAARRAGLLAARGRAVLLVTDSVQDTQRLAAVCRAAGLSVTEMSARHEAIEARVIAEAGQPGRITVTTQMAGRGTDIVLDERVREAGGLHVLNLQHNRSARVDRQVAGRAGRRGDPGSVEHWIRLDDSPLAPANLPAPLRPLGWLAAREARSGRGRHRAAALLLRAWQRWCEHDDRDRRARLDRYDRHWSRALSFTRIKV
ncbi:MAG: hypothetical protein QM766_06985 [Burkholderiaceae bacterium]